MSLTDIKTPITLSYLYIVERFGYWNSGLFKDSKQKYSKVVVTGNLHPLNANWYPGCQRLF